MPAASAQVLPVQFTRSVQQVVRGGYQQVEPLVAKMGIQNTGPQPLTLGLQRQQLAVVPGSVHNFCFGTACYPPNASLALQPITVAPGATDTTFMVDYEANGNAGVAVIRYAVYAFNSTGSAADTAYFTVTFDARSPTGLAPNLAASPLLGAPAPNPAPGGGAVWLPIAPEITPTGATLRIIDLRDGRHLATHPVSQLRRMEGRLQLPLGALPPGLYGCLLVQADGRNLAWQRLVVE